MGTNSVSEDEVERSLLFLVRLGELIRPSMKLDASYLSEWRSGLTRSQMRMGIRSALADLAEDGFHLRPHERQLIDDILKKEGFTTFSELLVTHGKRIKRLLSRKKLTHEDDAIMLNSMLSTNLLTAAEAATAERLIEDFGR